MSPNLPGTGHWSFCDPPKEGALAIILSGIALSFYIFQIFFCTLTYASNTAKSPDPD